MTVNGNQSRQAGRRRTLLDRTAIAVAAGIGVATVPAALPAGLQFTVPGRNMIRMPDWRSLAR
jgi:3-keto-L-gulonate-6-phosphate decarboxylase